jgi:hypothetical protein
MAVDYVAVIGSEADRIMAAYTADPTAKVPWSDHWSVNTVAQHEALRLLAWGRLDVERADVAVEGDREVLERCTELVPPV